MEEKNSSIIIYQSEDGNTRIEVKLENETGSPKSFIPCTNRRK